MRYSSNNYDDLEVALKDAANWTQFIENDYERKMSFEDLQDLCLERCLEKHENVINDLQNTIGNLEEEINDLQRDKEHEVADLEKDIENLEAEIEDSTLPDKTLNDVEKIEFLKQNWDNITYDNLKEIITPNKQKDYIINKLFEEKESLSNDIDELNEQIENIEENLYNKHN